MPPRKKISKKKTVKKTPVKKPPEKEVMSVDGAVFFQCIKEQTEYLALLPAVNKHLAAVNSKLAYLIELIEAQNAKPEVIIKRPSNSAPVKFNISDSFPPPDPFPFESEGQDPIESCIAEGSIKSNPPKSNPKPSKSNPLRDTLNRLKKP